MHSRTKQKIITQDLACWPTVKEGSDKSYWLKKADKSSQIQTAGQLKVSQVIEKVKGFSSRLAPMPVNLCGQTIIKMIIFEYTYKQGYFGLSVLFLELLF